jgi:hypothetical protein
MIWLVVLKGLVAWIVNKRLSRPERSHYPGMTYCTRILREQLGKGFMKPESVFRLIVLLVIRHLNCCEKGNVRNVHGLKLNR